MSTPSITVTGGNTPEVTITSEGDVVVDVAVPVSGTGDVVGPASSTNNNVALFNGASGKIIKDGGTFPSLMASSTTSQSSKADPLDTDEIPLIDSASSFGLRKITWAQIKTALSSIFSPIANPIFTGRFRAASSTSATGNNAIAIGAANTAGGANAVAIGSSSAATATQSVVLGDSNTAGSSAGASRTFILGSGINAQLASGAIGNAFMGRGHTLSNTVVANDTFTSGRLGTVRHSNERIHAVSTGYQSGEVILRAETSDTTPTELAIDGLSSARFFTLLDGQAYDCLIRILARRTGGSQHAVYWRRVLIQRTGATTSLPTAVQTIGTDFESDSAWNVSITANSAASRLSITVTGAAGVTIAWSAHVIFNELTY